MKEIILEKKKKKKRGEKRGKKRKKKEKKKRKNFTEFKINSGVVDFGPCSMRWQC